MPVVGEFFPENRAECLELMRLNQQEGRRLLFTVQVEPTQTEDGTDKFYVRMELDPHVALRGSARMTS